MNLVRSMLKIGAVLVAIELLLRTLGVPAYIIPSPLSILSQLFAHGNYFLLNAVMTICEAGLGIGAALVVGTLIAMISCRWVHVKRFTNPTMTAFQAMPVLAFGPLITTWFGPGLLSKAILSLFVCLPVIVVTVAEGLQRVPSSEFELFRMMEATR